MCTIPNCSFLTTGSVDFGLSSVAKAEGATATGGTVNGTGSLTLRAVRVGADTTLAQIVRMVEEAQGAKLPIQGLVDKDKCCAACYNNSQCTVAAVLPDSFGDLTGCWLKTGDCGAVRRCGGVPLSSCEPMRALSVMASCMAMHVQNMRHKRFPPALT